MDYRLMSFYNAPPLDCRDLMTLLGQSTLNDFAALPHDLRRQFRKEIQLLIRNDTSLLYAAPGDVADVWAVPRDDAEMHLPMKIGNFTDFMCALEHVQTTGRLAGYGQVPANFFSMPLAYNGRASSVIVSGVDVSRPNGILNVDQGGCQYAASKKLDYEVEMGMFVSQPVSHGNAVAASVARNHIFGFVLLNDWSARDVQFNEMMPLGPFNGKAFATSISPWVVTLDALEDTGALVPSAPGGDVTGGSNTNNKFLECSDDLSVRVTSYISRNDGKSRELLAQSDLKHLYWSPFQMLAHHSSSGCGLLTGDLLGTGTLSSTAEQAAELGQGFEGKRSGCLHELVLAGTRPLKLGDGSVLTWLEDGDTVILEGWAGSADKAIGFGELVNQITPVKELPQ
ncbi:fumarylacetoacetate hydrolase [Plectosphaerella cucumerina]|uniref:Fumarylacetoacetase n=1 Tax=Plectosphaerella cucumerina TaxID=40658 RepID=A0A8K0WYU4_9PEZI|nr:fumarylacetoacetate hydrolase [Plectosphaerella cucumerina]